MKETETVDSGVRSVGGWWHWTALLVTGTTLMLFANGRHSVAIAAWLAPIVLLRFVRSQPVGRGLLVAWLVLSGTFAYQFLDMVPLPAVWYVVLALVYGLAETLPFMADRLVARRLGGFRATLVLPCAWVAMEYLVATLTPYGSWGSAAYSQHEQLALLQLVSVTGLYGVSFLIAWFASVCNWAWERDWSWPRVRRGALAFGAVVAAALTFGGVRLSLFPPQGDTVRIASLTRADIDLFDSRDVQQRALTDSLTADETEDLRGRAEAINVDLLDRSRRETRAGAKIVLWGEANAFVLKADEPSLLERSSELALDEGIYLGVAAGVWDPTSPKPLENKLVLIDVRGEVAYESLKAIPVPGPEAAMSATDEGRIQSADTPFGRIGGVICFDMDFPGLLRQAGDLDVDIMLVPSNDWRGIDPWHSHMARFRAIEQGFNLVRHTSGGLSLSADYQGRVLSSMDHYTTDDRVLVSHVPIQGVATLYSLVGDVFAWLAIVTLALSVVVALKRH